MPKYYVSTGDLKIIIDRKNPNTAAIDAFKTLDDFPVKTLSSFTLVSEEGFDTNNDNDLWFNTIELLEQSNQISSYKYEDWL